MSLLTWARLIRGVRGHRSAGVLKTFAIAILAITIFAAGMLTENWLLARLDTSSSSGAPESASDAPSRPELTQEAFAAMVVVATNQARRQVGLTPLVTSDALTASARAKRDHLLAHRYWDHVAPDGTTPWDALEAAGYEYVIAGENLAKGFFEPEKVITGWLNSPTHRDNLLSLGYAEIGVAAWYLPQRSGAIGAGWVVMTHYATPR